MMSAMTTLSLAAPTELVAGRVLTHHNLLPLLSLRAVPAVHSLHTANAIHNLPVTTHALHGFPALRTVATHALPTVATHSLPTVATHSLHGFPAVHAVHRVVTDDQQIVDPHPQYSFGY